MARPDHRAHGDSSVFSLVEAQPGGTTRSLISKERESRMANLLKCKPLDMLMKEASHEDEHSLKRALGPLNLITLGIGAIIGAGIFVLTDRKSTRLNSSHLGISYAVFCLKKKHTHIGVGGHSIIIFVPHATVAEPPLSASRRRVVRTAPRRRGKAFPYAAPFFFF